MQIYGKKICAENTVVYNLRNGTRAIKLKVLLCTILHSIDLLWELSSKISHLERHEPLIAVYSLRKRGKRNCTFMWLRGRYINIRFRSIFLEVHYSVFHTIQSIDHPW